MPPVGLGLLGEVALVLVDVDAATNRPPDRPPLEISEVVGFPPVPSGGETRTEGRWFSVGVSGTEVGGFTRTGLLFFALALIAAFLASVMVAKRRHWWVGSPSQ